MNALAAKLSWKSPASVEAIENQLSKIKETISKLKTQALDKEENKTVALGTSKINYMDPRISVVFCKTFELPIEKVYTKTLLNKFPWAMECDLDWKF